MRKSNLLYLFPLSKASGFRKIRPNVWTKIWAKQLLPERSGRSRFVSVSFRAGDRPQRVQALGPAEERTPQRPNGGPYHRSSSGKDRFARQGGAAQTVPCARRALAGVTPRLLTTPGFPPTRTGLRAAVRPCARPRCGPSGLFATAPRFFESTQRACPGGEPPGYPPAQFGYVLLFPASETGRFAGSISGLWPCAGMLSAVLCTQSGAYQGKKVGAWRPFHEFAFRIMPDQAPNWVCKTAPTLSAAGRSPLEGHLHRRVQDAGKLCWHFG